eukprot:15449935-Alexandrium_andersonii.AAC.1
MLKPVELQGWLLQHRLYSLSTDVSNVLCSVWVQVSSSPAGARLAFCVNCVGVLQQGFQVIGRYQR